MSLTRKSVYKPELYCPICGVSNDTHGNCCSVTVLRAIDAANTRLSNDEDEEEGKYFYDVKSVSERLDTGYKMLNDEDP